MTRFGIGGRVAVHAKAAIATCPSLQGRNVTPHTFRHTTALHLIEAGNDMAVVKDAALKAVNDYFERALRSVPEIDAFLNEIAARKP